MHSIFQVRLLQKQMTYVSPQGAMDAFRPESPRFLVGGIFLSHRLLYLHLWNAAPGVKKPTARHRNRGKKAPVAPVQ
jgi:hypothetical protein